MITATIKDLTEKPKGIIYPCIMKHGTNVVLLVGKGQGDYHKGYMINSTDQLKSFEYYTDCWWSSELSPFVGEIVIKVV